MATVVDALVITLGLDSKGIDAGVQQAQSRISGAAQGIVRAFAAPLASGLALTSIFRNYLATGNEMHKLSQRLKMDVADIQAWGNAVDASGGDIGALQGTLNGLNEKLKMVRLGRWQGEFMMMGISVRKANGDFKDAGDILADLAKVADRMDKRRFEFLARRMGIDDGTIRLLMQGSAAVSTLTSKYKDLALTQKDAENARKFDIALGDLNKTFQAAGAIFMRILIPALKPLVDGFAKFINFLRGHERFIIMFFTGLAAVLTMSLIPALKNLGKAILTNPLVRMVTALLALVAVLEDLYGFVRGDNSAFEQLLKKFGLSAEAIENVRLVLKGFFDGLQKFWPVIVGLIGGWKLYTISVAKAGVATIALNQGVVKATGGFKAFGTALLTNPIFLFVAALVTLLTHLEMVDKALNAMREGLREAGRAVRDSLGIDPNAPMLSDIIEVEHGGVKSKMSRAEAIRSGLMSESDAWKATSSMSASMAVPGSSNSNVNTDNSVTIEKIEVVSTDPLQAADEIQRRVLAIQRISTHANTGVNMGL